MNRNNIIKILTVTLMIILVTFIFYGWVYGFKWEKVKIEEEASKYVQEKYSLTPIDINAVVSVDGICGATIFTDKLPFAFDVIIDRSDLTVIGDLYLETLTEYHLGKFIKSEVSSIRNDCEIKVVLQIRFSKDNSDFNVEKINTNPNIIFEMPELTYYCFVEMPFVLEESYMIFKRITEKFTPTSIYFQYYNENQKNLKFCIDKKDFEEISNIDDFVNKFNTRV